MAMGITRSRLIAALDVGTTKACCFIARVDPDRRIRVIGIGHQVSNGMKAGAVVDMESIEETMRSVVGAAERMADETVDDVIVNVSGGSLKSHTVGVEVEISGREVGEHDLRRVLEFGKSRHEPGERSVLHALPVSYMIDGSPPIRNPRGMFGSRLSVNVHVVTVASGPLRNLSACAERGRLKFQSKVASPYASGLACLVEDEMDLGVTCVDMGGGTTSVTVFFAGHAVYVDVLPVGGNHVTNDIARGLSTPTIHAERMKTLYGCAVPSPVDDRSVIDVPQVGEFERETANHIPRSSLTGIIQPRLEETFEMVRDSLEAAGYDKISGRRVVLTGGASQLQGVGELAARILNKQVRLGKPIRMSGLAEATGGPAFSTCAGLLRYGADGTAEIMEERIVAEDLQPRSQMDRVGRWLRHNF
ncbi:MAG: cell division protein FtsA [Rhodospirillales bacterium]|nr:cell division protein FtsA [Rhodospirillales bacterium]